VKKTTIIGLGLVFARVFPLFSQDKEQDRVENAGKVLQEILKAPDGVLDKADCVVILPSVGPLVSTSVTPPTPQLSMNFSGFGASTLNFQTWRVGLAFSTPVT
jgi:hypothetical protein